MISTPSVLGLPYTQRQVSASPFSSVVSARHPSSPRPARVEDARRDARADVVDPAAAGCGRGE